MSNPGCCTSSFHQISSSFASKYPLVLVVEWPVIALSSHHTILSSSHCAGWLSHHLSSVILLMHHHLIVSLRRLMLRHLSSRHRLVLSSPSPLIVSSSSRCTTLSSSHHADALSIEHAGNQEFEFNLVRAYINMLEPQAKYLAKFPRDHQT